MNVAKFSPGTPFPLLVTPSAWAAREDRFKWVRDNREQVRSELLRHGALLFRGSRWHYAEHLVLVAYTSGFRVLFLGLVAVPVFYFAELTPISRTTAPVYLGLWLIYFSVAAIQFYRGQVFWTAARAVVGGVLAQVIAMAVIVSCVWVYAQFAYS